MTWTDDQIDRLKSLQAEGLSGSQIAAQLGISRNAVIGKLTRLAGIDTKNTKQKREARLVLGDAPVKHADRHRQTVARTDNRPLVAIKDLSPEHSEAAITLFDIGFNKCRWPLNDVNPIQDFRFCGAKCEGSWCPAHEARVWAGRRMECEGA